MTPDHRRTTLSRMVAFTTILLAVPLAVSVSTARGATGGEPLARIAGEFPARVLVSGLASPDGLAIHPTSGELYVAEQAADRISVIRHGQRETVIETGFEVLDGVPKWALRGGQDEAFWLEPKLRSPEGIAFASDGRLFVTEDASSGRIFEFLPNRSGQYDKARVIPVPWLNRDFGWGGVTVARDGRLFVAGSADNAGPGLFFGSLLMRDLNKDWWVVDYGPFSGFSSVTLSRGEDILVVSDEIGGSVTWWDTLRHKVINTSDAVVPNAESVCILADGSIVVSQESMPQGSENAAESNPETGGGRLLRINPETQEETILASGFGSIESVIYCPADNALYVSEDGTGSIIELDVGAERYQGAYLLHRSLYAYEMSEGIAPKKWPKFLREFVNELGVQTSDESATEDGRDRPTDEHMSFTVREFADRIPMIAGRVKVMSGVLMEGKADPVSQIDFIVFYPGKAVVQGGNATPSLSLFSAQHASGRVEKTKVLNGYKSVQYSNRHGWAKRADEAFLYFPMTTCSTRRQDDGVDVTLAFLGMGHTEDYFLELECGRVDRGRLMVEGKSGRLADYEVLFTEMDEDGDEVRNIMIAGVDPDEADDYSWMKIGTTPVDSKLNFDQQASWMSYRMASFKSIIKKKEREWEMVRWDTPSDGRVVTAPDDTPTAQRKAVDQHVEMGDEDTGQGEATTEREEYEALSWTNMILSRAIETWQSRTF